MNKEILSNMHSSKKKPFFTVVIPTYNRAAILPECIGCVLDQTFDDFEIVLIDNGSTDNTRKLYENYADKRLRYVYQQGSGSPASPRNTGLKNAAGDWICFLDSDDLWYKNKLEQVKKTIESDQTADVFCHNELMRDSQNNRKKIIHYGPADDKMYEKLLTEGNRLSPSATTVRRCFILEHSIYFDEDHQFDMVEDYDFWLNLSFYKAKFNFIEDVLGEYILHDDNSILLFNKHLKNTENVLQKHVFSVQNFEKNTASLWKKAKCLVQLTAAIHFLRKVSIHRFCLCFMKALWLDHRLTMCKVIYRLKKMKET